MNVPPLLLAEGSKRAEDDGDDRGDTGVLIEVLYGNLREVLPCGTSSLVGACVGAFGVWLLEGDFLFIGHPDPVKRCRFQLSSSFDGSISVHSEHRTVSEGIAARHKGRQE